MLDWTTMEFIFGYNASDSTYGWKGQRQGLDLYYSHFTDEHLIQANQVPLTNGLLPIVIFQTIKKTFLGQPYTNCTPANAGNNFQTWVRTAGRYSQRNVLL